MLRTTAGFLAFCCVSPLAAAILGEQVPLGSWTGASTFLGESFGQVNTTGGFSSDNLDFTVNWNIAPVSNSVLRYTYDFSGYGQDLSFLVFQLTPNCVTGGTCAYDVTGGGGQQEVMTHTNDFPPGTSIYGVKIEGLGGNQNGQLTVSFLSTRVPMYGNFLGKSGGGTAYNAGLTNPSGGIFLPVPNLISYSDVPGGDEGEIPEPGTLLLATAGVVVGLLSRHYRSRE